jgi:hypothetical protein
MDPSLARAFPAAGVFFILAAIVPSCPATFSSEKKGPR